MTTRHVFEVSIHFPGDAETVDTEDALYELLKDAEKTGKLHDLGVSVQGVNYVRNEKP